MKRPSTKSDLKTALRDAQRAWLDRVTAATGLTLTEIAVLSDMHPSTLTRFRNNPKHVGTLAPLSVSVISDRTKVPIDPDALERPLAAKQNGFREREAEPYFAEDTDPIAATIETFIGGRAGIDPWTLRSRALEYEGYRPGDVLMVDLNAKPEPGDIVCAQIYDRHGGAETVFRIYAPPVLIGAGPDEGARKPRFLDNDTVVVKGVVVMSFRRRAVRAAA